MEGEGEGEGNERSGLLIYFSDYSPHISSDLEVECSDLSVLKLSLPKGPRTFFHFVMVVFYILPLFPSLSSALWPKSVPAVLRAALLRARRLPLRVRGSARCCGRTGVGIWGEGREKRRRKERKNQSCFLCVGFRPFPDVGAVVSLEILPVSLLGKAALGRFAPPAPCGGYAGDARGPTRTRGCATAVPQPARAAEQPPPPPPVPCLSPSSSFPSFGKGDSSSSRSLLPGGLDGISLPCVPGRVGGCPPTALLLSFFFVPLLLLQSRTENPAAPWGSPRILSAPSTDSRSQPPPPRAAHRAHSLGTHTCKP